MVGRISSAGVLACAFALAAGALAAPDTAHARERVVIREVLGKPKRVFPDRFATARARCPRGFVAISGGLLLGAIEPVADFRAKPRVWKSDGYNPSNFTAFSHRVQVICMSGRGGLRVSGAAAASVASSDGRVAGSARGELAEARMQFAKGGR